MSASLLEQLIEALRVLPGVGQKSAQRMAYHLLQHDRLAMPRLAEALRGANAPSLGILLGGLGGLAPERRGDIARLGLRAILAATLANLGSCLIAAERYTEALKVLAAAGTAPTRSTTPAWRWRGRWRCT